MDESWGEAVRRESGETSDPDIFKSCVSPNWGRAGVLAPPRPLCFTFDTRVLMPNGAVKRRIPMFPA